MNVPYPEFPNERPFENFVERLLRSVGASAWIAKKPKYEDAFRPYEKEV